MITMNNVRKSVLAAVLSLGLGSVALTSTAQTAAAPAASAAPTAKVEAGRYGHAVTQEQRQARQAKRAEHHAKRQAALHDALKLSAAQEGAWASFVNATKPTPKAGRGERGERAQWASLSAPARLEKQLAHSRERTAKMEARLAALNSFYAVLTPEQKKTFDAASAKRGGRGDGHHGRHGRHGGHRMQG